MEIFDFKRDVIVFMFIVWFILKGDNKIIGRLMYVFLMIIIIIIVYYDINGKKDKWLKLM